MLVDDIGDVTVTNDGATILKLLEVEHPAAKVQQQPRRQPPGGHPLQLRGRQLVHVQWALFFDTRCAAVAAAGAGYRWFCWRCLHPRSLSQAHRTCTSSSTTVLQYACIHMAPSDSILPGCNCSQPLPKLTQAQATCTSSSASCTTAPVEPSLLHMTWVPEKMLLTAPTGALCCCTGPHAPVTPSSPPLYSQTRLQPALYDT
jgi:hypothetical protein